MSDKIKLTVEDGRLHTPHAVMTDGVRGFLIGDDVEKDVILVAQYPEGDCDTVRWPKPDPFTLRRALYDAREMGIIPDVLSVLLPDGTEFEI